MGNETSKPIESGPREPHKLSKPRTQSLSDPPKGDPRRPTFHANNSEVDCVTGIMRSSAGERRYSRDQGYRSFKYGVVHEDITEQGELQVVTENDGLAELSMAARDRLSRSGSLVSSSPSARASSITVNNINASKLSVVTEGGKIDMEHAIRILEELKKTASPEDLIALHKALLPLKEGDDLPEEVNVDATAAALIRRRSFLRPGVATRGPTKVLRKPVPRRSPPPAVIKEEPIWVETPATPSESTCIESLDLADDRPPSTPRAQTPGDFDYAHLGGFKVGTLRVTNGAPSPEPFSTPRMLKRASSPDLRKDADYFAATIEAGHGFEPAPADESISPKDTARPRGGRPEPTERKRKMMGRAPSPLKMEACFDNNVEEVVVESVEQDIPPPVPEHKEQRSISLAQDYMLALPSSPFATQGPFTASPIEYGSLVGSARHEDMFEDEGLGGSPSSETKSSYVEPDIPYATKLTYRETALRMLNGLSASQDSVPRARPSLSQTSSVYLDDFDVNTAPNGRPVTKSDSGYSSESSYAALRSKSYASSSTSKDQFSDTTSSYREPKAESPSRFSKEIYTTVIPEEPRKEKETLPAAAPAPAPEQSLKKSKSLGRLRLLRGKSWRKEPADAVPALPPPVPSSTPSATSQPTAKPKKLQKHRPTSLMSMPSSASLATHKEIAIGNIPSIPNTVAESHLRRLSLQPSIGHFDCTFPSFDKSETPDVPELPEQYKKAVVEFPQVVEEPEEQPEEKPSRMRRLSQRLSRAPSIDTSTSERKRSMSRSRLEKRASREAEISREPEMVNIADLGTVAESLGASPYDIALSALNGEAVSKAHPDVPQPHHIGTTVRPKAVGMDSETAANFSRIRSRDRQVDGSRSESRHRSKSRSRDSPGQEGDHRPASRDRHRTQSMITDAPPVPALPANAHRLSLQVPVSKPVRVLPEALKPGSLSTTFEAQPISQVSELPASPVKRKALVAVTEVAVTEVKVTPAPPMNVTTTTIITPSAPAPPPAAPSDPWAAQASLWSQRRKSIGENLRKQYAPSPTEPVPQMPSLEFTSHPFSPPEINTAKRDERSHREADSATVASPTSYTQDVEVPERTYTPYRPEPSAHSHSQQPPLPPTKSLTVPSLPSTTAHANTSTTSLTPSLPESVLDRYSGGLAYGYEQGFGLGGSAGTRHARSGASRKSVEVGRRWGVDLGDVPVFVRRV